MTIKVFISIVAFCISNTSFSQEKTIYKSETLIIKQLTAQSFVHTSNLETKKYGPIACNGVVFIINNEAIVYDTPANKESTIELIDWLENTMKCTIKAVVPTHFHFDCLGGLEVFHKKDIPSYAHKLTIEYAQKEGYTLALNQFEGSYKHQIGGKKVISQFFGAGHTHDNIVGYFPEENIMFGGCLIKALKAGDGNLEDADVEEWPYTVQKIKSIYPTLKIVVPGHGKSGGINLLDYTIGKFKY